MTLLCLLTLSGCKSDRQLPAPQVMPLTCPKIARCQLPASNPATNGELIAAKDAAEAAWAQCAARVDMTVDCQEKYEQTIIATGSTAKHSVSGG
ncbi:Rz1-like lysis system protein LysC [Franconibacter helveticus]|uniref:Rz1-like lysis system protein LysC n=1 Tax=Franconibacter helveticus TaxID=357240 RepID=UPI001F179997|nr:Rz1-like lysis system protein LysC [Franconibacter helveticus]